MKDADLERRFLDFVFTTDAVITVGAVAYHAGCTIEEAEAYLDRLASAGRLRLEHDDDGNLFYVYPDRAKVPAPVDDGVRASETGPSRPCPYCGEPIRTVARKCRHCGEYLDAKLRGNQPRALVRMVERLPAPRIHINPGTAAVLSLLWPGAGQIYSGRVGAGLVWMSLTMLGYVMLVVPGFILHLLCIVSAANSARALNERGEP